MRYRAFLSYSHADAHWARWLLHRLESYRVPPRLVGTAGRDGPIPAKLGAIFRDRDELPSAGDLSGSIRAALSDSATLVVICSPDAARSKWVDAEAAAFRDAGRDAQVLCFVVAGDPARGDCFPPAVLADAQGRPREPLAADARKQGDGRERAFLKLVAGLLGVGFDALAQREAQRRHRRLAWLAAAAVAGMAVTSTLAVSAYVARNDAQRRQAQAEDILGFMLGDLRQKLTTVGRLDLMRSVDDKATTYFATLDPRDLSDRALEEQARSLTGIGQVRLEEGKHDAAMAAFREAHARSTALHERQPADGRRLFDLAQAQYWIGFVYWQQGNFDAAQAWLTRYRDSALQLAAMDRDNFDWQKEVAYGNHNLAVLDESRGRYPQAERTMRQVLALYRTWTAQRPRDTALRAEAANVTSWLGTLALQQGRLREATGYFGEQLRALALNRRQEPDDVRWRKDARAALALLSQAQSQQGDLAGARASLAQSAALAQTLAAQDPGNRDWRATLALSRLWQAELDAADKRTRDPLARAHAAEADLAAAHAGEPEDERLLAGLASARVLVARLALARGDAASARAALGGARALLEPAWKSHRNETLRLGLANALVAGGEAAQAEGDAAAADAAWRDARRLLESDAPGVLPFARLDPLVRTLRHLGDESAAMNYRARLDAGGYVPLQPWPDARGIAAAR